MEKRLDEILGILTYSSQPNCARGETLRALSFVRVEQLVARVAHNHEVAGSSPAPATSL